jgi:two-component system, sporulation sensor kinase B
MTPFKDLLLNVLIVLLPIFIYQTFWIDKAATQISVSGTSFRNRLMISVFSTLSVLTCMSFPVDVVPGFLFDLRLVPLVVGILYGGLWGGLPMILVFALYRFSIGGVGALYMVLSFSPMFLLAFALLPRYPHWSRRKKAFTAMGLASMVLVVTLYVMLYQMKVQLGTPLLHNPYLPFTLLMTLLTLFCLYVSVYLIENMREKAVLRQEVLRAEKFQALAELTASMTHEIRNPLTVVRGFLQLLKENGITENKKQMFLKMGIDELDRSESIIRDYLAVARPQIERQEPVNVSERIHHVTGIISSFATLKGVDIDHAVDDELYVNGDPEKLSQVLMNLVKNGIEAMKEGGILHVRAVRKNRHVVIDVIDSGVGMTREETARLGNPFYSTKENGTGLGLMVSYQIVHSMNGKIEVTSEKGTGTQFTITLPSLNS